MKYLLDTHILLWMVSSPEKLSKRHLKILSNDASEVYISIASIWEMGIKISLKKLELSIELEKFVNEHILNNGLGILGLKKEHLFPLAHLPFHHRDPFDRLLISQSLVDNLTILTADKIFKKYDITSIY